MKRLRRSVNILKLSTLALLGAVELFPTQASAQFSFPIPIPRFDLRPSPSYHSAPSHRSGSEAKHEDNNQSSTEKDATQAEPNASPATQQQQVSAPTRDAGSPSSPKSTPSQNNPDTPPLFAPSR